jgi:hypothetical protein
VSAIDKNNATSRIVIAVRFIFVSPIVDFSERYQLRTSFSPDDYIPPGGSGKRELADGEVHPSDSKLLRGLRQTPFAPLHRAGVRTNKVREL